MDLLPVLFKLQAQVTTGVELNSETNELKSIGRKQLLALQKKYYQEARDHYEVCQHPEYNLWARLFPEEAKILRPAVKSL
jgi:hypothetical protein